jgi:hypothetical protein
LRRELEVLPLSEDGKPLEEKNFDECKCLVEAISDEVPSDDKPLMDNIIVPSTTTNHGQMVLFDETNV